MAPDVVARSIELGSDAYRDLEAYDDEAFMCVSLFQLGSLADCLGVTPHELVVPPRVEIALAAPVPMGRVVYLIKNEMRSRSETADSFADRVGWDVASAIKNPDRAWKDWNVDCLQDISRAVGLDWWCVLASWPGRQPV